MTELSRVLSTIDLLFDGLAQDLKLATYSIKPSVYELISTIFDSTWYHYTYYPKADPDRNWLQHYLKDGWRKGHSPHPLLDECWYRKRYPNVTSDALSHYVATGAKHNYDPSPYFYIDLYSLLYPEVAQHRLNPLWHYQAHHRYCLPLLTTSIGELITPFFEKKRLRQYTHFLLDEFLNDDENLVFPQYTNSYSVRCASYL